MLLKILGYIPLIQCLVPFPFHVHKTTLKKILALWILTSLPFIVAVIISPIPDGSSSVGTKLLFKLRDSITVSELFVYAATFMTPLLYMIYERIQESSETKTSGEIVKSIRRQFRNYGLVALLSIIIMIFTAIAFGLIKAGSIEIQNSFLGYYLNNLSWIIYFFSLFCWYLTLLDGESKGNFVLDNRMGENKMAAKFSERMRKRKTENEK